MTRQLPPFVHINGKLYLVVNYDLGGQVIDLKAHLDALLRYHGPGDILLLRPLSMGEAHLLTRTSEDATIEAWARLVVKEEDRTHPRR